MLGSLTSSSAALSAANISLLFRGVSSPKNSTDTDIAQSSATTVSPSDAHDPAKAIKEILAKAQVQSVTVSQASGEWSQSFTVAEAAYAVQMDGSSATVNTASNFGVVDDISVHFSVTTVTNEQGKEVANFEMGISARGQSAEVAFSVEGLGLGKVTTGDGKFSVDPANAKGDLQDFFQISLSSGAGTAVNLGGLDADQAKKIAAAFVRATGGSNSAEPFVAHYGDYEKEYSKDFSVGYAYIAGY